MTERSPAGQTAAPGLFIQISALLQRLNHRFGSALG